MIKLQILDETGHKELELMPAEALQKIQPLAEKYWAFVDDHFKEIETLTQADIEQASNIKLTLPLQGG